MIECNHPKNKSCEFAKRNKTVKDKRLQLIKSTIDFSQWPNPQLSWMSRQRVVRAMEISHGRSGVIGCRMLLGTRDYPVMERIWLDRNQKRPP